jgi:hypothetical protein
MIPRLQWVAVEPPWAILRVVLGRRREEIACFKAVAAWNNQIKWWCRVLDPILREHEPESALQETKALDQTVEAAKASATAYSMLPGNKY